ncbi:MAG: M23 family metallopeptidase [Gemmiger sp.]|uniref:murein hydrolase activator EnvC family protein n=1 Tax=Gemmiger sp. TaxID=2049027 RepID=UPI002E7763BB|nr:M23 family metallopeptidase [Gemmiger sp.]MEE0801023.1 M23 family metallopeptidase [Gemmiger sp.]
MKKVFLWLVMVVVVLALLLGGAGAAMYLMTDTGKLPDEHPTFGQTTLEPVGYEWVVPVLGDVLTRTFEEPTTLTVQKLGDLGDTIPALVLPDWVQRTSVLLTGPSGNTVVQGDADALASYVYTQNGQYELTLTLYRDEQVPGKPCGWYRYQANYTVNLQPKAVLSSERVGQGGVAALLITGILDGSEPQVETDLGDVWFRPVTGGYLGYIPVTYNAEGGDHTLTVTCGSLTQELTLTVTQTTVSTVDTEEDPEIPGAAQEYRNAIWPLYTRGSSEKLWQGLFAAPVTAGIKAEYGSRLRTNGSITGHATGINYAAPAGQTVTAPQNGTVEYAGTLALTGGTVVIDHGCGVKSYLFGMDAVQVQKGQSVTKGDALGTTSDVHTLIWELRIGSKSVNPDGAVTGKNGLSYQEGL